MKYTLKGIKTKPSRGGTSLDATLYRDGKEVARIHDEGIGGAMDFYFPDQTEEKPFAEFAVAWSQTEAAKPWRDMLAGVSQFTAQDCMEGWTNSFVDGVSTKKKFDRMSKTKTLFQVKGDPSDEWRTVNAPYSERVQQFLDKTFNGTVTKIYGKAA